MIAEQKCLEEQARIAIRHEEARMIAKKSKNGERKEDCGNIAEQERFIHQRRKKAETVSL